jgi:twitching motility protein PilT
MFPPEEQEIARLRLADGLQAVISQRLLPRADGKGRVAALEILIATGTVRDMIRDPNRTSELRDYMRESREQYGMQTFDQHLMDLVADETVTYETAAATSSNPADFELQMRTLRRRSRVVSASEVAKSAAAAEPERPAGFTDGISDIALEP